MATSSDSVKSQEYVDFDEYIDIQLRKTGSTIKTTDVLTAVVGILTLVTLYLLVFDYWYYRRRFRRLLIPCVALWVSTIYPVSYTHLTLPTILRV